MNKIISALALHVLSECDKHERVGSSLHTVCEIRKIVAQRSDIFSNVDPLPEMIVESVMIWQCAQTTSDRTFSSIFLECFAGNAKTKLCI